MRIGMHSLWTKLVCSYLLLGVAPLMVVGYLGSQRSRTALIQQSGDNLRDQAATAAEILDRNLFERYGDVQVFAAHPDARRGGQAAVETANFFTKTYGYYDLMVVADASGKIVACNTLDSTGKAISSRSLVGQSVSDESWFQACLSGQVGPGKSATGDFAKDTRLASLMGTDGSCLRFSSPIRDESGRIVGAWSNLVSTTRLVKQTLDEMKKEAVQAGQASVEIDLLSDQGVELDTTRGEGTSTGAPSASLVEQALKAEAGSALEDKGSQARLAGFSTSKGFSTFPGFHWRVVVRQSLAEATAQADLLQSSVFRMTSVAALLVLAFAAMVVRKILSPVQQCVHVMNRLAAGDLTAEVQYQSRDELGQMAQAANQAVRQLRRSLQTIAQESLSLAAATDQLKSLNYEIGSEADEVSNQALSVSAGSEEVSQNISSVAAAAQEMSYSIGEISRNASRSTLIASRAVERATTANAIVERLSSSSSVIDKVIRSIHSIAEQTNLLALNATIEAARAGELGKGFAVVASEVKDLARETATASENISGQISAMKQDVELCLEAIAQTCTIINEVNDISNSIASAVEEQSATTQEIGKSVSQAASASGGITNKIETVAASASQTNKRVSESQDFITRLQELSHQMAGVAGQFQLDSGQASQRSAPVEPTQEPARPQPLPVELQRLPIVTPPANKELLAVSSNGRNGHHRHN